MTGTQIYMLRNRYTNYHTNAIMRINTQDVSVTTSNYLASNVSLLSYSL